MKTIVLAALLLLGAVTVSFAQDSVSVSTGRNTSYLATTRPVSDSMRQVVHKLFKWGRLYGLVSTVSGGLVLGSSAGYAIGGDGNWKNVGGILLGGTAVALGTTSLVRFSRRHEREVLAGLERGETVPSYVLLMSPFLRKSKK